MSHSGADRLATPLPRRPLRVSIVQPESVIALVVLSVLSAIPISLVLVVGFELRDPTYRFGIPGVLAAIIAALPLAAWMSPWLLIDPAGNRVRVFKWWPLGKINAELSMFQYVMIDTVLPLNAGQRFRVGLGGSGGCLWLWRFAPNYLLARRFADRVAKYLGWSIQNSAWRVRTEHHPARMGMSALPKEQNSVPVEADDSSAAGSTGTFLELINEPSRGIRWMPWICALPLMIGLLLAAFYVGRELARDYQRTGTINPAIFKLEAEAYPIISIIYAKWLILVSWGVLMRRYYTVSGIFHDRRRGTVAVWQMLRHRPWYGRRRLQDFRMLLLTSNPRRFLFWNWQQFDVYLDGDFPPKSVFSTNKGVVALHQARRIAEFLNLELVDAA